MGSLADNGGVTATLAARIDEGDLIQPRPTVLALIAARRIITTIRAFTLNVAISEKPLVYLAVELLVSLLLQYSLLIVLEEKFLCSFVVERNRRTRINVKAETEAFKSSFVQFMETIDERLGWDSFLLCLNRDRNTMFIRATYKENVGSSKPLVTDENIRGEISAGEMP